MARILTVSRNCHHPIETLKLRELSYSDNFSFLSARIRPAGRLVPVQTFSDDQNQENLNIPRTSARTDVDGCERVKRVRYKKIPLFD